MRVWWPVIVIIVPCACAQASEDMAPATEDSSPVPDARLADTTDAGDVRGDVVDGDTKSADGSAEADAIFPVDDGAVGLCATPAGTTVTASGSWMSTPDSVVDGSTSTGWNSGGYDGWLDLKLPKAVHFDRIHIAAGGLPACTEPYTFKASLGGVEKMNEAHALDVPEGTAWLPPIAVAAGDYDELRIEVGTSASWISIAEIVVYDSTAKCP